jgi:glycogen(starch) synthase
LDVDHALALPLGSSTAGLTLRVLVLSSLYPPQVLGGYERSCHDVMTRFAQRGHEVLVLTTDTQLPGIDPRTEPNVRAELKWYWRDHEIVQPGLRERLGIEHYNRRVLQQTLADARPDVVSVWSMGAMSLGLIQVLNDRAVPAVYVVCDEWPVYGPKLDAWLTPFRRRGGRPLAPLVARLTGLPTLAPEPRNATVCWLSAFVRDRVRSAAGWSPARETVTYSGIDTTDFPLAALGTSDRRWGWQLLAVGRVEPRKGFADAVDALATLPAAATLRIVGPDDGTHRAELETRADKLGIVDRVSFGAVPRSELRNVYQAADALLFTSAWEEPFGLVPVEAMACGTPVVAAATGGAREFLADGVNSLVVPPRDSGSLAAAIHRLADDERLRQRIVAGGVATSADLTVDRLADVLEEWHVAATRGFQDGEPTHRRLVAGAPAP